MILTEANQAPLELPPPHREPPNKPADCSLAVVISARDAGNVAPG